MLLLDNNNIEDSVEIHTCENINPFSQHLFKPLTTRSYRKCFTCWCYQLLSSTDIQ